MNAQDIHQANLLESVNAFKRVPFRSKSVMHVGFPKEALNLLRDATIFENESGLTVRLPRRDHARYRNVMRTMQVIRTKGVGEFSLAMIELVVNDSFIINDAIAGILGIRPENSEVYYNQLTKSIHPVLLHLVKCLHELFPEHKFPIPVENYYTDEELRMPAELLPVVWRAAITLGLQREQLKALKDLLKEEEGRYVNYNKEFTFPSLEEAY